MNLSTQILVQKAMKRAPPPFDAKKAARDILEGGALGKYTAAQRKLLVAALQSERDYISNIYPALSSSRVKTEALTRMSRIRSALEVVDDDTPKNRAEAAIKRQRTPLNRARRAVRNVGMRARGLAFDIEELGYKAREAKNFSAVSRLLYPNASAGNAAAAKRAVLSNVDTRLSGSARMASGVEAIAGRMANKPRVTRAINQVNLARSRAAGAAGGAKRVFVEGYSRMVNGKTVKVPGFWRVLQGLLR